MGCHRRRGNAEMPEQRQCLRHVARVARRPAATLATFTTSLACSKGSHSRNCSRSESSRSRSRSHAGRRSSSVLSNGKRAAGMKQQQQ